MGLFEFKSKSPIFISAQSRAGAALSIRTNELFDIQDKILLYDLTNTYFEGEKRNSKLAKFGRSKEKRNDARLVVLAMVVNIHGFVKYSSIHEGNFADSSDISLVLQSLEYNSGAHPAMVVIDACVSRSRLKGYQYDTNRLTTIYHHRPGKELVLKKIIADGHTDYLLEVNSKDKAGKEQAMKNQFEQRLEQELQKIKATLYKKGGVKTTDKVNRRIGRLAQRYPSVCKYYNITITNDQSGKIAIDLQWHKDPEKLARKQQELGKYILPTNVNLHDEVMVW